MNDLIYARAAAIWDMALRKAAALSEEDRLAELARYYEDEITEMRLSDEQLLVGAFPLNETDKGKV